MAKATSSSRGLDAGDPHLEGRFFLGDDQLIALTDVGFFVQRPALEVRIERTQLPEGQVILMGNVPERVTGLDRVHLLGLLDVGKRLLDVRIILQAVLEVKAVLQCDLLVESHAHVGVIGDLVGFQTAGEIRAQRVAVAAYRCQLTVQIQGRALADLGRLRSG